MNNKQYLALARKYRPMNFDDLIGQQALVKFFQNAFNSQRIHHGYIFTGIRGVGKTTTARIIAKALNCIGKEGNIDKPHIEVCGECLHCKTILEDRNPDVMEMDAASKTGIDDIREIIDFTKYLPVQSRYKVIIIDEIHMLSTKAFNALLKTLEEPPSRVIFIFATTEIKKVPITILSRCQRFDLKRLSKEDLTLHLANICNKEQINFEKQALEVIVEASEGSVRDSLSILDQAINISSDSNNQALLTADNVIKLLGRADYSNLTEVFINLINSKTEQVISQVRELYYNSVEAVNIVEMLMTINHYLLTKKTINIADQQFYLSEAKLNELNSYLDNLSVPVLTRIWNMLVKGLNEIKSCPQELMALEMLLIRICYVQEYPTPIDLLNNNGNDNNTAPISSSNIMGGNNNFSFNPQIALSINSFPELISVLRASNQLIMAFNLENYASLVNFEPGRIELNLHLDFDITLMSNIKQFLFENTGKNWQIITSEKPGDLTLKAQKKQQLNEQIENFKTHPEIMKLFKAFPNAEILAITEKNNKVN